MIDEPPLFINGFFLSILDANTIQGNREEENWETHLLLLVYIYN